VFEIDWSAQADLLRTAADLHSRWNESVAHSLVRPGDRVAVDIGCGGGGMARALATALPDGGIVVAVDHDEDVLAQARDTLRDVRARCEIGSLDDGPDRLREVIGEPADLVWAAHAVHHAGDQQACVDTLAALLAPGGRLALAEGGLPTRTLPWDVGVGEPGLELRLDAANDRWFARMRAELPGSTRMPYGWPDALRQAGLGEVTSRTVLTEKPTPLSEADRTHVIARLTRWVERIRDTGFLTADDLGSWDQLFDEDGPHWLGRRTDLTDLTADTIHLGRA
jgi:ubiquinone/menaquinone biosynthesis C-methylase UbiE